MTRDAAVEAETLHAATAAACPAAAEAVAAAGLDGRRSKPQRGGASMEE